ncbi:MAG TPA: hypothetical protein VKR32_10285, partial [Puia sp.]|nr:hypothetical protein [Puia sp.]
DMQKNGTNSWKNGIPAAAAQQLPKIERDINYLYDRFQEGDQSITNIEPEHYNYLKTKGLISFPQSATDRIKETAVHFIQEEQLQASEQTVLKYMKIFGMQRFFQDLLKSGEARVFAPEGNRIVKTNQVQTHDYGQ